MWCALFLEGGNALLVISAPLRDILRCGFGLQVLQPIVLESVPK